MKNFALMVVHTPIDKGEEATKKHVQKIHKSIEEHSKNGDVCIVNQMVHLVNFENGKWVKVL